MTIFAVDPDPKLTFGSINLLGTEDDLNEVGFYFEAEGDDTSWGNPSPVIEVINSLLRDGAVESLTNYQNREIAIRLRVIGENSNYLAIAEAALMLETGKANQLIWTPPDGFGEPCVFEVTTSSFEHLFDHEDEIREYPTRVFGLKIRAIPFPRALDLTTVTVDAPAGAQTFTTIDSCDTTAGWATTSFYVVGGVPTGAVSAGITSDAGDHVMGRIEDRSNASTFRLRLERTGLTENVSVQKYVRVRLDSGYPLGNPFFYHTAWSAAPGFRFRLDGAYVAPVAQSGYDYWFDAAAAGITTLHSVSVEIEAVASNADNITAIYVADLSRSNLPGSQPSTKQLARTLPVAGSVRTQGTLQVYSETDALGEVLLYTSKVMPGIANPNLAQFLVSGNTRTADTDLVSGAHSDLSVLHAFEIPIGQVASGGHLFMARLKASSDGEYDLTWAVRDRIGGVLSFLDGDSGTTTVTVGTDYVIVAIDLLDLPYRKIGTGGLVRIELTGEAGMTLDEAWIFNLDYGDLTQVYAGDQTRFWVDAPTLDNPYPGFFLGSEEDRSDSYFAGGGASGLELHEFAPPAVNVFTVTTGAPTSALEFSHYRRAHTHIADEDAA